MSAAPWRRAAEGKRRDQGVSPGSAHRLGDRGQVALQRRRKLGARTQGRIGDECRPLGEAHGRGHAGEPRLPEAQITRDVLARMVGRVFLNDRPQAAKGTRGRRASRGHGAVDLRDAPRDHGKAVPVERDMVRRVKPKDVLVRRQDRTTVRSLYTQIEGSNEVGAHPSLHLRAPGHGEPSRREGCVAQDLARPRARLPHAHPQGIGLANGARDRRAQERNVGRGVELDALGGVVASAPGVELLAQPDALLRTGQREVERGGRGDGEVGRRHASAF